MLLHLLEVKKQKTLAIHSVFMLKLAATMIYPVDRWHGAYFNTQCYFCVCI